MWNRRSILAAIMGGLVATALPVAARADDGEARRIYEKCVAELRETVQRCRHHQAEVTEDCIRRIKRLKEAGKPGEAAETARRCVRHLNEFTDECVEHLHHTCRRCIRALTEIGATRAARELKQVCENAVRAVRHSEDRAVEAIKKALTS